MPLTSGISQKLIGVHVVNLQDSKQSDTPFCFSQLLLRMSDALVPHVMAGNRLCIVWMCVDLRRREGALWRLSGLRPVLRRFRPSCFACPSQAWSHGLQWRAGESQRKPQEPSMRTRRVHAAGDRGHATYAVHPM